MRYGDPWIWGIYLTLVVLSIVESYSASSRDVALMGVYEPIIKQVAFLLLGSFFVIGLSRINYNNKVLLMVLIPCCGFSPWWRSSMCWWLVRW